MKAIKYLILSVFLITITLIGHAQQDPPPPPNAFGESGNSPAGGGAPIGSGISLLIGLGLVYGTAKSLRLKKDA